MQNYTLRRYWLITVVHSGVEIPGNESGCWFTGGASEVGVKAPQRG
ncbi:hypothetical protein [Pseudoalteromonas ruthenica]|nr:hypothetical protein [Pseudoalteromonas ruthenica]